MLQDDEGSTAEEHDSAKMNDPAHKGFDGIDVTLIDSISLCNVTFSYKSRPDASVL